jgi:hypothetical protein
MFLTERSRLEDQKLRVSLDPMIEGSSRQEVINSFNLTIDELIYNYENMIK